MQKQLPPLKAQLCRLRKQRNELEMIALQLQFGHTHNPPPTKLPVIVNNTKAVSSTKGATGVITESTETKQLSTTQLITTMGALQEKSTNMKDLSKKRAVNKQTHLQTLRGKQ